MSQQFESNDLSQLVRDALREEKKYKRKYPEMRRLLVVVTIASGCAVIGYILKEEALFKGWEIIIAGFVERFLWD